MFQDLYTWSLLAISFLAVYIAGGGFISAIVNLAIELILIAINSSIKGKIQNTATAHLMASLIISLFLKDFYYFTPLAYLSGQINWLTCLFIPIVAFVIKVNGGGVLLVCLYSFLAYLYQNKKEESQKLRYKYYHDLDQLNYKNRQITQTQNQLQTLKDLEVKAQVQKERQRITNDIHDEIGHQLSSSIIQLGALEHSTNDPQLIESIKSTRITLQKSMDNIRSIIHQESSQISLAVEIGSLVEAYEFCPVDLKINYQTEPNFPTSHSLIQIVQESLTNTQKHSQATRVTINLSERKNSWILLIQDNGQTKTSPNKPGLGLIGIEERVRLLGGVCHISQDDGFRVFVKIDKEEENESNLS